eukprot:GEZU01025002.1.p1 GENE.GEZU01025002.1~~GEZU01025002.1.p1  ORF type:complete len:284 (-),score=57.40 GEZU01025002.1:743-1594(-)
MRLSTGSRFEHARNYFTVPLLTLPNQVMDAAKYAIQFWANQKDVEIRYTEYNVKAIENQFQQKERAINEQLEEAQSAASLLHRKNQALQQEVEQQKQEFVELQEKYSEKNRTHAKLQELYNQLKKKYEQMSRDNLSTSAGKPINSTMGTIAGQPIQPQRTSPGTTRLSPTRMFGTEITAKESGVLGANSSIFSNRPAAAPPGGGGAPQMRPTTARPTTPTFLKSKIVLRKPQQQQQATIGGNPGMANAARPKPILGQLKSSLNNMAPNTLLSPLKKPRTKPNF